MAAATPIITAKKEKYGNYKTTAYAFNYGKRSKYKKDYINQHQAKRFTLNKT